MGLTGCHARKGDAFTLVFPKRKSFRHISGCRGEHSLPREEEPLAQRVGKEWGAWGAGLAHPAWLFRQIFLFVCLGMFQHKSFQSRLSPGPMIMLITPRSGGGFHPAERWEIPAEGQLFSSS